METCDMENNFLLFHVLNCGRNSFYKMFLYSFGLKIEICSPLSVSVNVYFNLFMEVTWNMKYLLDQKKKTN